MIKYGAIVQPVKDPSGSKIVLVVAIPDKADLVIGDKVKVTIEVVKKYVQRK